MRSPRRSSDLASGRGSEVGRPRVVVVDDEPEMRALLRLVLEQDGFAVVGEAGDGAAGVVEILRVQPDIVVTDLVMPGIDGLELVRALLDADRTDGRLPPVVLLTAFADDALMTEAETIGIARVVSKQDGVEGVAAVLQDVLAHPPPQRSAAVRDR